MNSFVILHERQPWCKMLRNTKCEKSDAKYPAIYISFFAFHECFMRFHSKFMAGLTNLTSTEYEFYHVVLRPAVRTNELLLDVFCGKWESWGQG